MSKIVLTDAGLEFQEELLKESRKRDSAKSPNRSRSQGNLLNDYSGENSSFINIRNYDPINESRSDKNLLKILQADVNNEKMNPYLQRKIENLSKSISKTSVTNKKNLLISLNESGSQSQIKGPLLYDIEDPRSKKDYSKIMYNKAYLQRLTGRYEKYKQKSDFIEKSIQNKYQKYIEKVLEKKRKPPVMLAEINEKNKDASNVLLERTRAEMRFKSRIERIHAVRYMKYWNTIKLPPLTEKYKRLNN